MCGCYAETGKTTGGQECLSGNQSPTERMIFVSRFAKIAAQLEKYNLDAMLLTAEANRFYGSGFHSTGTDGMAGVTKEKFYYSQLRLVQIVKLQQSY